MADQDAPSPSTSARKGFDWLTILILIVALANGVLYLYNRNKVRWGPMTGRGISAPASDGFQAAPGSVPARGVAPPAGFTRGGPAQTPAIPAPPPPGQPPATPGRSILE